MCPFISVDMSRYRFLSPRTFRHRSMTLFLKWHPLLTGPHARVELESSTTFPPCPISFSYIPSSPNCRMPSVPLRRRSSECVHQQRDHLQARDTMYPPRRHTFSTTTHPLRQDAVFSPHRLLFICQIERFPIVTALHCHLARLRNMRRDVSVRRQNEYVDSWSM